MINEIESYKSKNNDKYSSGKKQKIFIMTEPNFYEKKLFSKTMKNIREITLNRKKVKKYSINIRNELIKKMEKKPKLKEKQIYSPLYVQIRKSLRDIENEKKIAEKYILSEKDVIKKIKIPLYNSIFKLSQKKSSLLLENEEKNNNYFDKPEKTKSSNIRKNNIFFKTFSGNILSNKIIERNKDKNKTSKIFFRTEYNNDLNISNNNNNTNILSPTNSNSPIITKKSTIIKTETNEPQLNININNSTINKTIENNNIQELKNSIIENKVRYKTYFIEYEPDWYNKNKFIKKIIDKNMVLNSHFQKSIITDELALIFENMKIFQSQYLIDKNLPKYFNKISWYTQKALNLNLEEATGLLTEISYLLLNGYENIMQNFISNPIERITKKKLKSVYDEKKEFITDIYTFSETYIFLQVCYEAYCIITSHKDEYYISKKNFEILIQYLDRARYIISKICLDLKNMYKEQNKEDKKIIEDCLKKIKNVNRKALINNLRLINTNIISNINFKKKNLKSKVDCHLKFGIFNSGIDSFRYKGPKKLKLSEEHLINLRINKAFGANSYRELKPHKHIVKFDINSSLVNKLMKYATNEFKSKVISERIRQRFIST